MPESPVNYVENYQLKMGQPYHLFILLRNFKLIIFLCFLAEVESSYQSISQVQKLDNLLPSTKPYCLSYKRLSRKISTGSNFGWMVQHTEPTFRGNFNSYKDHYDRVEHLLSITPSEYVRRDKERKNRELGLRSCIQSLTSLLEKALNNEMSLENLSRDAIKRSINTIRENFENQISDEKYQLSEFPTPSLQSLIAHSAQKNMLKSIAPSLLPSLNYDVENLHFSYNNFEDKLNVVKEENKEQECSESENEFNSLCIDPSMKEICQIFNENYNNLDKIEGQVTAVTVN